MMFFEKCDRCQKGDENRWKGVRRGHIAGLVGDFRTILCPECVNDWTLKMRDDEDYLKFSCLEIRQKAATMGDRANDAVAFEPEILRLKKSLFAKAEAFVAEDVVREDSEEDEETEA